MDHLASTTPLITPDATVLRRIDAYPYRHRVRDVMKSPAKVVRPDLSLGEASALMTREQISSVFVARQTPAIPQETGIVTERDLLRAVASRGADALAVPVDALASRPLVAVAADAFIYRAIARMSRLKVRHLGVMDDHGKICGALSARDLLRVRAQETIAVDDEIEQADDAADLARAWARMPDVASALVREGVTARDVAAVISHEIAALTGGAARMAERRMRAEGRPPPCAFALAVLGSAGRGESLLALDQDNAVIFAGGEPGSDADLWFERFGSLTADILNEAGVPYCKGGVMAKNAPWRGSIVTWRSRIADWIRHSSARDLLSVDIFFDLLGVYGDLALAHELREHAFAAARGQIGFAKLLAEAAGPVEPALRFFGRFRTKQGRIDLKKAGLFGIVTSARVLAICHQIVERSTPARLAAVAQRGAGKVDLDALIDAHATFLDLILSQQIEDIAHGVPATNAVAVGRLDDKSRTRLRQALEQVQALDDLTRDLLFSA